MKLHSLTVNLRPILDLPNLAIIHFKDFLVKESALFTSFGKKVLDLASQNWKIKALRDWIDQNPFTLALVRVCRVCLAKKPNFTKEEFI